jgi:hypothetical protein
MYSESISALNPFGVDTKEGVAAQKQLAKWALPQTLRVTPAMESGISNHVWTIEELVSLLVA